MRVAPVSSAFSAGGVRTSPASSKNCEGVSRSIGGRSVPLTNACGCLPRVLASKIASSWAITSTIAWRSESLADKKNAAMSFAFSRFVGSDVIP
uniref:Uncharacterized protein n=1 Tax=uncultured marine virus TaxID=186617 RepID=A0A0F7L394_9VIRU|nr:hypothetical protein [uncultured marine virus]